MIRINCCSYLSKDINPNELEKALYYISEDQTTRIDHAMYLYPCNDTVMYSGTETELLKIDVKKMRL